MSDEHIYEMTATTLFGLEGVLASELKELGAEDIEMKNRAVKFRGDKALMYRANINCRTALRILKPIHSFKVWKENQLYNRSQEIKWDEVFKIDQTFAINARVNSKFLRHSQYVALKFKDAIVDQFREKYGERPSVDTKDPDIMINIHIDHNECIISLDSSGDSLHKRGYRMSSVEAPLNEVLAAGIIKLSGWDGKSNFIDPMCGSGTILIEAVNLAMNRAPNVKRPKFGFHGWSDFDRKLFDNIKDEYIEKETTDIPRFYGFDKSNIAYSACKHNLIVLGYSKYITLEHFNFFDSDFKAKKSCLIMNPPYGQRLETGDDDFYKTLGDTFKQKFTDCVIWIITSDMENAKYIGLKPTKKIKLFNGKLECRLLKFEIYEGSRKKAKS